MPDEIIIPGGVGWLGHRLDDFAVGAEHTVFEWCIIYTDWNPTEALGDDRGTATARFQDLRLKLLGARGSNEPRMRPHPTETDQGVWDDMMIDRTRNAVYQELAEGITSGRLEAKRVYLDDRPGELDPTLCILDAAPVLAIARRRKDHGQYIGMLLAATASAAASIKSLAEWIFTRHSKSPLTYKELLEAAAEGEAFKKLDFTTAFGKVYDTHRGRRPAGGWPLRSPYKERWQAKNG